MVSSLVILPKKKQQTSLQNLRGGKCREVRQGCGTHMEEGASELSLEDGPEMGRKP